MMGRWEGIEEYICVVEVGSFTAAAERLGASKSYISKQVGLLEDRLGVRLLQRTTRRLTLTESGEVFFAHCKEMSEHFDRAESTLSDMQLTPRGTLKLAINSRYGTHFMAGAVAAFSREYPDMSVEVHSSFRDVDLLTDGYDLTLRYDDLEDSSLKARGLGAYSLSLCASPDYWQSRTMPASPEDLQQHNCLTTPERCWLFNTDKVRGTTRVKVSGNWISEDGANLLAAARAGIGLAQLPDFFVREAVARGELVKVPRQQWNGYDRQCWAVYPNTRYLSAKVRYFIDFLIEYVHHLPLDNFEARPVRRLQA
ncbi:LysR family transcriptional regulator [Parahaliea aestuarii]|uniref:LysR family transcriptional regulator n=1 Tax=Parahaliea aestuarii TaxID=1852021 RepID=A0A5C8ZT61_9GAMM|nr:LysR family transcriptional regulator [Parahaliea aestuarii]TXS91615.1 LysR family transcriptional regulator [Parahaliea aestuarii]